MPFFETSCRTALNVKEVSRWFVWLFKCLNICNVLLTKMLVSFTEVQATKKLFVTEGHYILLHIRFLLSVCNSKN